MRYNTYRQYVTLNGVKRESKMDVIKNLKPLKKNIMRYIPKTDYEQFVQGATKVTINFVIKDDNTVYSLRWNAYSGSSIIRYFDIPLPKLCYFNGIADGNTGDAQRHVTFQAFTASDQVLTINRNEIGGTSSLSGISFTADVVGPIIEYESDYQTNVYSSDGTPGYRILIPKTMSYYTIEVDYTDFSYNDLPMIPITVFE